MLTLFSGCYKNYCLNVVLGLKYNYTVLVQDFQTNNPLISELYFLTNGVLFIFIFYIFPSFVKYLSNS